MPVETTHYGEKQTWLDKNRNLLITIRHNVKGSRGTVEQSDKNPIPLG